MATREYPSIMEVQAYGRAAMASSGTRGAPLVMQPGLNFLTAPTGAKPRLKMMNDGTIRILGVDSAVALFPPLNPLAPIGQYPEAGMVGRTWDYAPGYNLRVTPRDGQEWGFGTLRALADGYDVLSGLIERVKDKVVSQPWSILPVSEKGQPQKKKDSRSKQIEQFLKYPDKEHTFGDWMRELLDQVIVYDAPAIYLRMTRGGELYSMEVLDGSMITPKIMLNGRPPPADVGPAYQQVIKRGLPAIDYVQPVPRGTAVPIDPSGNPFPELLYKPRNPRVHSPYGRGPVEQMITTITIAINREAYLAQYYSSGSTPDLIFSCPESWTTQDVANFKIWWDSVLAGNLANRRGTQFVGNGVKVIDTKEKALTDETDQWLIRIMCFFLGLNPMPFVKMMNRATGQAHQQQGEEEGLSPFLSYLADLFNHIIRIKWGYFDLEFRWEEKESTQPAEQATIDVSLVNAKIYHPDEIRAKRGDDPMADDMRAEMDMPNFNGAPNSTVLPPDQQDEADQRTQANAEHAASLKPKPEPGATPQQQQATKTHELELAKLSQPIVTVHPAAVTVAAPTIEFPNFEFPPINIAPPAVTVNMPEMKSPDVFVDVGAVNIKQAQATPARGERQIVAKRNPDGSFEGEIIETTRRTVRSPPPAAP